MRVSSIVVTMMSGCMNTSVSRSRSRKRETDLQRDVQAKILQAASQKNIKTQMINTTHSVMTRTKIPAWLCENLSNAVLG